jgi:hypothetical protein
MRRAWRRCGERGPLESVLTAVLSRSYRS